MSSSEDSPVKGKCFRDHQRQTANEQIKEIKVFSTLRFFIIWVNQHAFFIQHRKIMLGWFGTFHPTYKKYPKFERLNVPLRMECLYGDVRNQKMEACFYFDTLSKHFRSLVSAVQSTQKLCLVSLSLIHIWRCRRSTLCRSRWSPYH